MQDLLYLSSSVHYTPNKTKNDLHMLHINSAINNLSLHASKSKWKACEDCFLHLTIFVVKHISSGSFVA